MVCNIIGINLITLKKLVTRFYIECVYIHLNYKIQRKENIALRNLSNKYRNVSIKTTSHHLPMSSMCKCIKHETGGQRVMKDSGRVQQR